MNMIRNSLLTLAAVGAFALAGAAQASGGVIYQGTTTLTAGGVSIPCTLTIAGTISSSGAVTVDSAGATGSSSLCSYVYLGGFPWTGSTSGTTLSTGSPSTVLYTGGGSIAGSCGGTVTGLSYSAGSPPASVTISGANNYGGSCTITGTLTLDP